MTLTQMLAGFVRRHWHAYASAAVMLASIALLTVWIPRQVGHVVDGLVAGSLRNRALLAQLGLLAGAGACIYMLRVGWRMALFAAAYRLASNCAPDSMHGSLCRARSSSRPSAPAT